MSCDRLQAITVSESASMFAGVFADARDRSDFWERRQECSGRARFRIRVLRGTLAATQCLRGSCRLTAHADHRRRKWCRPDVGRNLGFVAPSSPRSLRDSSPFAGVHTHMTNTRLTDPEVLERRYPTILHQMSLRKGSGGVGLHNGGDGVVRVRPLSPCLSASLTTTPGNRIPRVRPSHLSSIPLTIASQANPMLHPLGTTRVPSLRPPRRRRRSVRPEPLDQAAPHRRWGLPDGEEGSCPEDDQPRG